MNDFLAKLLVKVDEEAAAALTRAEAVLTAFWAGKREETVALYGLNAVKFLEGWVLDMEPGIAGDEERLAMKKALPLILSAFNEGGSHAAAGEMSAAFDRQDEAERMALLADRAGTEAFCNWFAHAASWQDRQVHLFAFNRACRVLEVVLGYGC